MVPYQTMCKMASLHIHRHRWTIFRNLHSVFITGRGCNFQIKCCTKANKVTCKSAMKHHRHMRPHTHSTLPPDGCMSCSVWRHMDLWTQTKTLANTHAHTIPLLCMHWNISCVREYPREPVKRCLYKYLLMRKGVKPCVSAECWQRVPWAHLVHHQAAVSCSFLCDCYLTHQSRRKTFLRNEFDRIRFWKARLTLQRANFALNI